MDEMRVWLVSFRHKTKTPRYLAAIDAYFYATDEDDAREKAEQTRKAMNINARWWTWYVSPTLFDEIPDR